MSIVFMFIFILILLCIFYVIFCLFISRRYFINNLQSRYIFVTGCDSGFGHNLVLKLVENGIPTFAGCLTESGKKGLEEKCKVQSGRLWTLSLDVTSDQSVKEAAEFVKKTLNETNGKLWAIVCNAGIGTNLAPDDWLTVDDYKKVAEVNTFGMIRTCHMFKPLIKQSKGRILIVSSVGGRIFYPFFGPYNLSKYATEAYGDCLRMEGKLFGYSVHIIEPGFDNTHLADDMAQGFEQIWGRLGDDVKNEYGEDYCKKATENRKRLLSLVTNTNLSSVVDGYYEALFSRFPRRRYVIGVDANLLYRPMTLLPTEMQDMFLRMLSFVTGDPPLPACSK